MTSRGLQHTFLDLETLGYGSPGDGDAEFHVKRMHELVLQVGCSGLLQNNYYRDSWLAMNRLPLA